MKSKLFKILGVVAVVAMLASAIVAPVAATVASVTATVATANNPTLPGNQISAPGNYSIYATLATQLMGAASGSISLPDVGDQIVFTSTIAYDKVTLSGAILGATFAAGGAGTTTFNATTGVLTYTAIGGTATFTSNVTTGRLTTGGYVINAGNPTISYGTDANVGSTITGTAFTLPDMATTGGTASSIVFTPGAATNQVTLTFTTGAIAGVVWGGTAGTFNATTGVINFVAGTTSATVTATVNNAAGTWANTGTGAVATGAVGAVGTILSSSTSAASGDTITVTFPTGFTVPNTGVAATLAATSGWVTFPGTTVATNVPANLAGAFAAVPSSSTATSTVTLTLPAGAYIGSGAQILINITAGVINPATAGSYAVTVATSQETTAVTSSTFAIVNPIIPVIAGVATVYNSAGIQMTQSNDLAVALLYVQTNTITGAVIKLTAGTYNTALVGTSVACTIQGTDASAANVILKSSAAWAMTGKTVVIDSVTIDGTNGTLTVGSAVTGGSATVSNSNVLKGALTLTGFGTSTGTLNKDTFTVKTGAVGAIVNVPVKNGGVITACTFNVTGTGIGLSAIDDVTVSGSTFTGAAVTDNSTTATGVGISLTAGATAGSATSITTSTFTGLSPALVVADGTNATFSGNTVTNCGVTSTYDTIVVNSSTGTLYIVNNKITGSLQYIATVNANDNMVFIMDNNFATNVKNVNNVAATVKLNATHNFWGTGITPPASTSTVDYSNPLGSLPTSSNFVTGVAPLTLDATAAAGVNITASTVATTLGAAALTGNPVTPTISSANTVVKYFDVFGTGAATATIDFYGATPASITANSQIFFYNTTFGVWQACSNQTINTFGNYVEVTISGTTTAPTAAQFNGLPFALVTVPTAALPGVVPPATVLSPVNGAVNVPISNLTFTWPAVAGTGVTYQFALAQASANTSAAPFAILDYSDNTTTNAEPSQETLQYNTIYWWEVRAITMNASGGIANSGPWAVQMFTTAPAPVTTTGTGTVVTNTSLVLTTTVVNTTVVQTSTNIVLPTSTGTNSPAIPSYLLWAVIAVGAVLIIAVIVLIVRTRRIP